LYSERTSPVAGFKHPVGGAGIAAATALITTSASSSVPMTVKGIKTRGRASLSNRFPVPSLFAIASLLIND
jgi:hypothetical protein